MLLEVEGHRERRVCKALGASRILNSFDAANDAITARHHESSRRIADEGINYLKHLGAQRANDLKNKRSTGGFPEAAFEPNPSLLATKEPLLEHESNMPTPQKECSPHFSFGHTERKERPSKAEQQQEKDLEYLSKSLKKLGISEDDEGEVELEEGEKMDELKNKSLTQIILESRAKCAQKKQERGNFSDSDDSYPMTDYSSNDSSNHYEHEPTYMMVPTTVTDLNRTSSSGGSYSMESILDSPKKSKSQVRLKRRMFVGNKRVPRWAEDLEKVADEVNRQQADARMRPGELYGECLVERLNSNLVMGKEANYVRGSSAKWDNNPLGFAKAD